MAWDPGPRILTLIFRTTVFPFIPQHQRDIHADTCRSQWNGSHHTRLMTMPRANQSDMGLQEAMLDEYLANDGSPVTETEEVCAGSLAFLHGCSFTCLLCQAMDMSGFANWQSRRCAWCRCCPVCRPG